MLPRVSSTLEISPGLEAHDTAARAWCKRWKPWRRRGLLTLKQRAGRWTPLSFAVGKKTSTHNDGQLCSQNFAGGQQL